jgi:hypothetical protein
MKDPAHKGSGENSKTSNSLVMITIIKPFSFYMKIQSELKSRLRRDNRLVLFLKVLTFSLAPYHKNCVIGCHVVMVNKILQNNQSISESSDPLNVI